MFFAGSYNFPIVYSVDIFPYQSHQHTRRGHNFFQARSGSRLGANVVRAPRNYIILLIGITYVSFMSPRSSGWRKDKFGVFCSLNKEICSNKKVCTCSSIHRNPNPHIIVHKMDPMNNTKRYCKGGVYPSYTAKIATYLKYVEPY